MYVSNYSYYVVKLLIFISQRLPQLFCVLSLQLLLFLIMLHFFPHGPSGISAVPVFNLSLVCSVKEQRGVSLLQDQRMPVNYTVIIMNDKTQTDLGHTVWS